MNNIKKISIITLFILVFAPVLTFAQNTSFPVGSGANDFNRTAIQDPRIKNTDTLPTGSGYNYDNNFNGTALKAPSSGTNKPLVTCGGLSENGFDQKECGAQDVVKLIQSIMNLAFIFAGFIVATMFMYAGFLLITAAGDTGKIQKAKNIFKRTVIGFIVMYLSYILVLNVLTKIDAVDFFKKIIK